MKLMRFNTGPARSAVLVFGIFGLSAMFSGCVVEFDYGYGGWHSGGGHWNHPDPHYPHHPVPYPHHRPIVVGPRHPHRPVRFIPLPNPGNPHPHHPHNAIEPFSIDASGPISEITASDWLAYDYQISKTSAETLMQIAKGKKLAELSENLGVEKSDLKSILKLEMPSVEIVEKISRALSESSENIEALLMDFIADIRVEKEAQAAREAEEAKNMQDPWGTAIRQ